MALGTRPTLIYDGDCEMCTRAARWMTADSSVDAIPSSELGAASLSEISLRPQQTTESLWWIDSDGVLEAGHRAIAAALLVSSGWRRVAGRLLSVPLFGRLAAPIYGLVARHRYRISSHLGHKGGPPAGERDVTSP